MRYTKSARRAPRKPKPNGNGEIHDDWRDRRDEAQAKLAMLELQEREGMLLRKDLHERSMRLVATAVIAQFSSFPDRVAAEFGANDEQRRAIRAKLLDELNALRANLARVGAYADA
jgi:hypothetical protein